MTTKPVNSECLDAGRKHLCLEALWEMSQDVSIEEIRLACKDARRLALSSREDASDWREVMDYLFSMFIERKEIGNE